MPIRQKGGSPEAPISIALAPQPASQPDTAVIVGLSARLAKGAGLIREEWPRVQQGAPRASLDRFLLLWLDLMQDYYHAGGTGCAMSAAGGQCTGSWDPVPLCWSCAGGEGLPPKTERRTSAAAEAGRADTAPAEVSTAGITAPISSPVHCRRDGCALTMMHVHISTLGECRRKLASGLFGLEPSVLPQDHWERASELGQFGEGLVVKYLQGQGHKLENTLKEQRTLEFEENGVLYVGHPDGDIQHDAGLQGAHNLEIKCPSESRWSLFRDQGVGYAFPEYKAQAVGYMRGKEQNATHFAVMSRDSGRIFETEYTPHQGIETEWRTLAARIEEVSPIIMAGELPGPDFDGAQFECIVCEYGGTCPARQAALQSMSSGAKRK